MRRYYLVLFVCWLTACTLPWNNPYPHDDTQLNALYLPFSERPKHLDPARAYAADEYVFITQIYEPLLQYHYLDRPYRLIPATATAVPQPQWLDHDGQPLSSNVDRQTVAFSRYTLTLKPGIRSQPHPALAQTATGQPRYASAADYDLSKIRTLADFSQTGDRTITAHDYAYQIKRLADPRRHSPIAGLMARYIVGFDDFRHRLQARLKQGVDGWLDLDTLPPMSGVKVLDAHRFTITIKGVFPQFNYWLAMPFFSPMLKEAERFYALPGLAERNINLDWYPLGSGPYMLAENNPNARMRMVKNPNFREAYYPSTGTEEDLARGFLQNAGQRLPFIDELIFTLEKESIPAWNKFLQGYYDVSGISSEHFESAVNFSQTGVVELSEAMRRKQISLRQTSQVTTFYFGFNMRDPVVGGLTAEKRALRQAIAIAIDQEEYIAIFRNGRGVSAMSPIPPGLFGYEAGAFGVNRYVYDWDGEKAQRKSLAEAKALLSQAGYPNGRSQLDGTPLVINLDVVEGGSGSKAYFDWLTRSLANIDVQLIIRASDYNRYKEKMEKNNHQMFFSGWNADYPDSENFLFLLHGAESNERNGGENKANYENAEYDALFEQMKNLDDGPQRLAIIRKMVKIIQADAPWVYNFHPMAFSLAHGWLKNRKANAVANNIYQYLRVDAVSRAQARAAWNQPVMWPLVLLLAVVVFSVGLLVMVFRRRALRKVM